MARKDDRKNDLRLTDAKISAIKNKYIKKVNTDGLTTLNHKNKTRLTTFHTQKTQRLQASIHL